MSIDYRLFDKTLGHDTPILLKYIGYHKIKPAFQAIASALPPGPPHRSSCKPKSADPVQNRLAAANLFPCLAAIPMAEAANDAASP